MCQLVVDAALERNAYGGRWRDIVLDFKLPYKLQTTIELWRQNLLMKTN